MAISMLKIRRPLGRLIFNMGIAIPGKTVFLIEMAPRIRRRMCKTFVFYLFGTQDDESCYTLLPSRYYVQLFDKISLCDEMLGK